MTGGIGEGADLVAEAAGTVGEFGAAMTGGTPGRDKDSTPGLTIRSQSCRQGCDRGWVAILVTN